MTTDTAQQMTLEILVTFEDAETQATWIDDRIGWQFVLDLDADDPAPREDTMTETTRVTRLTALNVQALQLAAEAIGAEDRVTIGATVATFAGSPAEALQLVDAGHAALVRGGYRASQHPVRSLAAIRRKLTR